MVRFFNWGKFILLIGVFGLSWTLVNNSFAAPIKILTTPGDSTNLQEAAPSSHLAPSAVGSAGKVVKKDSSNAVFTMDQRITDLMNRKLLLDGKRDGKVKGYRVQIHFGSNREVAKDIKSKFMQKYSDVGAYEEYDMPNFKIRVGDFRSRLDAFRFLKQLGSDFPSAFIVQDDVLSKELIK